MLAATLKPWGVVGAVILGSAALLGAFQQIWVRLLRPAIRAAVQDAFPPLEEALKEFKPNHGSSIVDRVARIDEATGEIIDRMKVVEKKAKAVEERAVRLHTAVDHLERHALQFTEFERYERGRNHDLGQLLTRILLALHIKGIKLPEDADSMLPPANPPFPGDDPDLVPDKFPRNFDDIDKEE